ncbi:MAG: tRNA uridine-5-carboxymethylaminomethyl(34) synthesis GTPase MnmE [Pseudomonadota bacterium]
MSIHQDTIVGLSSGALPSGIAILRVSGPACEKIVQALKCDLPVARAAKLSRFLDPESGDLLDQGLLLWFPASSSFTGEDCLELHLHGSRAVVYKLLSVLSGMETVRLAEAGEFSRRAFENGKFDLTEIEGIADLIGAETEEQRKLALDQMQGSLRKLYEDWRSRLIRAQALIEAELDFSDEDDVPDDTSVAVRDIILALNSEILRHLTDNRAGEIIRDGFRVVVMGKPNVGKSSLLNHLAKREVAIVTEQAGTTRDILDVHLDIGGYAVILSDTAGLRETDDIVELEGIRRAHAASRLADFIIQLCPSDTEDKQIEGLTSPVLRLISKDDKGDREPGRSISVKTGHGIDQLIEMISLQIEKQLNMSENALMTRERHRFAISECHENIKQLLDGSVMASELKAELLRSAAANLGKVIGRVDVEDLLDVIFSEFCVGK